MPSRYIHFSQLQNPQNKALAFTYWASKFKQQLENLRNPLCRAFQSLIGASNFTSHTTIGCENIIAFLESQSNSSITHEKHNRVSQYVPNQKRAASKRKLYRVLYSITGVSIFSPSPNYSRFGYSLSLKNAFLVFIYL